MKLVERPALVARLREAVGDHALTMLAAPLGSGKSTALTLAFGASAGFARLDVEHWHRTAIVAALVDTVRTVRAEFGRASDVSHFRLRRNRSRALRFVRLVYALAPSVDTSHRLVVLRSHPTDDDVMRTFGVAD